MSIAIQAIVTCDRVGCGRRETFDRPPMERNSNEYYTEISRDFKGYVRTKHGMLCDACYAEWRKALGANSDARFDAFRRGQPEPEWVSLEVWIREPKPVSVQTVAPVVEPEPFLSPELDLVVT